MENSPLELYEKGYRLQYVENDLPEACRIYETIIREFPDSHECGYAVIQLEKIVANTASGRLPQPISGKPSALPVIGLIFNGIVLLSLLVGAQWLIREKNAFSAYQTILTQAIGKSLGNQDNEAIELLAQAKSLTRTDPTPYLLTIGIYRKNLNFDEARTECASMKKAFPASARASYELAEIDKLQASRESEKERSPLAEALAPASASSVETKLSKESSREPAPAPREKKSGRKQARDKQSPLIVPKEDITFF